MKPILTIISILILSTIAIAGQPMPDTPINMLISMQSNQSELIYELAESDAIAVDIMKTIDQKYDKKTQFLYRLCLLNFSVLFVLLITNILLWRRKK